MVVDLDVDKDVPMPYFVHACSFRQIPVRMYNTHVNYIYIWVYTYYIHIWMDGSYQCLRVCRRECMLLFVCLFVHFNVCLRMYVFSTAIIERITCLATRVQASGPDRNHPPAVR